MRKRITPVESPIVQQYVDRVGQRLAAAMPDVTFTFQVVAEDSCPALHEPTGFPGGYVFIPAALFLAAQDEAEFAGMLAHAMAHAVLPLALRQTNAASVPLVFVGTQGAPCNVAVPLGLVTTQRNVEMQADALALRAMAQAGFDPQGLVRYVGREQPTTATERSPIPPRDQRLAAMAAILNGLEPANYSTPADDELDAVRQEVRRLAVRPADTRPPTLTRQ